MLYSSLKRQKESKGFTLIEILLVVGFIALASIGVYIVYNKVQAGNAVNKEIRNISTIIAGAKGLYAGSTDYSTLNNTVLIKAKLAPENMIKGLNLIDGFGGQVMVYGADYVGTKDAIEVIYFGVPIDICTKFAAGIGPSVGLIAINGATVKDMTVPNGSSLPNNGVDMASAALACNSSLGTAQIIMLVK